MNYQAGNYQAGRTDDPIAPELLRSRLEAIGQEAGAAVQQTAISPIVTESKDYSVTILDAEGSVISAYGLIEIHYGAVMHAVRSTIAVHGATIAEGDVFLANDPHSGGGLHPQDVARSHTGNCFCGDKCANCHTIKKPVCGEDGIVYANKCFMKCRGTKKRCNGNCPGNNYISFP